MLLVFLSLCVLFQVSQAAVLTNATQYSSSLAVFATVQHTMSLPGSNDTNLLVQMAVGTGTFTIYYSSTAPPTTSVYEEKYSFSAIVPDAEIIGKPGTAYFLLECTGGIVVEAYGLTVTNTQFDQLSNNTIHSMYTYGDTSHVSVFDTFVTQPSKVDFIFTNVVPLNMLMCIKIASNPISSTLVAPLKASFAFDFNTCDLYVNVTDINGIASGSLPALNGNFRFFIYTKGITPEAFEITPIVTPILSISEGVNTTGTVYMDTITYFSINSPKDAEVFAQLFLDDTLTICTRLFVGRGFAPTLKHFTAESTNVTAEALLYPTIPDRMVQASSTGSQQWYIGVNGVCYPGAPDNRQFNIIVALADPRPTNSPDLSVPTIQDVYTLVGFGFTGLFFSVSSICAGGYKYHQLKGQVPASDPDFLCARLPTFCQENSFVMYALFVFLSGFITMLVCFLSIPGPKEAQTYKCETVINSYDVLAGTIDLTSYQVITNPNWLGGSVKDPKLIGYYKGVEIGTGELPDIIEVDAGDYTVLTIPLHFQTDLPTFFEAVNELYGPTHSINITFVFTGKAEADQFMSQDVYSENIEMEFNETVLPFTVDVSAPPPECVEANK